MPESNVVCVIRQSQETLSKVEELVSSGQMQLASLCLYGVIQTLQETAGELSSVHGLKVS